MSALVLLGCRYCGAVTKNRCPTCKNVAYCGPECAQKDKANHSSCKAPVGPINLTSDDTPFNLFQKVQPALMLKIAQLLGAHKTDGPLLHKKFLAVLESAQPELKLLTWDQLGPLGAQSPQLLESMNTRRPDQINLVLFGFGSGGHYQVRFSVPGVVMTREAAAKGNC